MSEGKIEDGWEAFTRIQVRESEGKTEVLVNGQKYMRWTSADPESQRMAVVQLYQCEIGKQEEIAKAFGIHVNSVYNYVNTFEKEGARGLMNEVGGPRGAWKMTAEMKFKILEVAFKNRELTLEEMVKLLEKRWKQKVSINSLRMVLLENGFIKEEIRRDDLLIAEDDLFRRTGSQSELELDSMREEVSVEEKLWIKTPNEVNSNNSDNNERKGRDNYSSGQRIYLDQLEQSSQGYNVEKGEYNAYGGGLLFVPMLERYNFIGTIKRVVDIKTHEGYSLEEFCLTLFYFNLFEFKSIEDFKTAYPEEFGILIGKLTSPSIFTMRRFLYAVRELKIGEEMIKEFAMNYLKCGLAKYGVLYIDGHFLPYYGTREITMGWNTIRDRAMKGSYNFIGNDEEFNLLIFLVRLSSEDLLDKIPEMIEKVKKIGWGAGINSEELTVIFDREGYSAELFRALDNFEGEKIKFITWAKYSDKWVNEIEAELFKDSVEVIYEIQEKEEIRYCEMDRTMNKYGKIRAIIIETGSKKRRSVIYTNDWKRETGNIIQLICRRWGQENSIKTLKLKHLIDYHPGYVSEELDEQPMVGNPELEEFKKRRAALMSQLHGIELKFAEKILDKTEDETCWKEMKEADMETLERIATIKSQITLLNQEIEQSPKEVKFDEAHVDRKLVELDYEKKRFLDCIKVFACHMEKKMCEILSHYYDKEKELLPLLHMIVNRGAHIRLVREKLMVRLKRFKDPEVDYAARHLCEELNQMRPVTLDRFHLPICYEVA